MFRTLFSAAVFSVLMIVLPVSGAFALSCAPPQLTPHAADSAAAIFEGVVVGDRRDDVNIVPGAQEALDKNVTYSFLVSKSWKGVTDGETVAVRRNIYWGDGFQMGKAYLVFAERRDQDGALVSGLCGLTKPLAGAAEEQAWLAAHMPAPVPVEAVPAETPPAAR